MNDAHMPPPKDSQALQLLAEAMDMLASKGFVRLTIEFRVRDADDG